MTWRLVAAALLLPALALAQADKVELNRITRVEVKDGVLQITGSRTPNFNTFTMSGPPRLVIDISEAVFVGVPESLPGQGAITGIKTASYGSASEAIARVLVGFDHEVETDLQVQGNTLMVKVLKAPPPLANRTGPVADAGVAPGPQVAQVPPAQPTPEQAAAEAQQRAAQERQRQEEAAREAAARAEQERKQKEAQAQREAQASREKAEAQQKAEQEQRRAEDAKRAEDARRAEAERQKKSQAEAAAEAARQQKLARERADAEAKQAARRAEDERQARLKAEREAAADSKKAAEEDRRRQQQEAKEAAARAEQDRQAEQNAQREAAAAAKKRAEEAQQPAKAQGGHRAAAGEHRTLQFVGFRPAGRGARVFLRTDAPALYSLQEKDARTVVVVLPHTRIGSKNNTRFLDTSFFGTPVLLVNPTEVGEDVHVEVKLRTVVPYQARQNGDELVLEFQAPAT